MSTGKHDNTDQIAQLLEQVGPRPPLADERRQRVRHAVHVQWALTLRARRRRQMYVLSGSLAAILALVLFLSPATREWIRDWRAPTFEGPVGEVATVKGLVWYASQEVPDQYPGRRLVPEDVLEVGTRIETTSDARVALQLLDGRSVRLDRGSRVRFIAPTALELQQGTLYVDSGEQPDRSAAVEIRTALGSIYDIGTQFEVRLADEALRVRVREGAINLERGEDALEATAGTELSVDPSGSISRREVPIRGPLWDWVLEIAPAFALEGSSLPVFLEWVSRETGRQIRFANDGIAESSSSVIVHGSVEGLRPDQALAAVLPTCGLMSKLDGESLVLESQPQ